MFEDDTNQIGLYLEPNHLTCDKTTLFRFRRGKLLAGCKRLLNSTIITKSAERAKWRDLANDTGNVALEERVPRCFQFLNLQSAHDQTWNPVLNLQHTDIFKIVRKLLLQRDIRLVPYHDDMVATPFTITNFHEFVFEFNIESKTLYLPKHRRDRHYRQWLFNFLHSTPHIDTLSPMFWGYRELQCACRRHVRHRQTRGDWKSGC